MSDRELLIKIVDLIENVHEKIDSNNDQLIKRIAERTEKIEIKLDNFITKEECNIKSKENISIRKFTALGIMFGAVGGSLIGLLDKLKKLLDVILKG